MFVILKMVRQIQNLMGHLRDACDRTKGLFTSSPMKIRIRLRVRGGIHILGVCTVQHAQDEEIERNCAGSEDNLQVAVVE